MGAKCSGNISGIYSVLGSSRFRGYLFLDKYSLTVALATQGIHWIRRCSNSLNVCLFRKLHKKMPPVGHSIVLPYQKTDLPLNNSSIIFS